MISSGSNPLSDLEFVGAVEHEMNLLSLIIWWQPIIPIVCHLDLFVRVKVFKGVRGAHASVMGSNVMGSKNASRCGYLSTTPTRCKPLSMMRSPHMRILHFSCISIQNVCIL
ncbi:hypothetical protein CsSME_00046567 [Camellia sinensis var. sinensis]